MYYDGEMVVNLSGGIAQPNVASNSDDATTEDEKVKNDWIHLDNHHISPVFSCSKVMESVVLGMLADRGFVDLTAPVSQYWPEFAAEGKGHITVEQVGTVPKIA